MEKQETLKNARRKLGKFQWMRQCRARKEQRNTSPFRKLKRRVMNPTIFQKTKHACIVEKHESRGQRLESSLPKDHEDHIAGKGYNSMTHYNLVHKFIPVHQAMKIPDATAVGQQREEARNDSSLAVGQSKEQVVRLFWKQKETNKKKVHLATLMDIRHLKNAELEPKLQKIPRQSRASR